MKTLIASIFKKTGTTNKFAVEFGCHRQNKSSVCHHLIDEGWKVQSYGIEKGKGIIQCFITAENVNEIFDKNGVPDKPDLMSIDIDGMDYWVWKAMKVRPRVVIIEYNRRREKGVQPYFAFNLWNKMEDSYYGASKNELIKLGKEKGYKLKDFNSENLFFVKK